MSISFQKPPSPKPSEVKSHHRTITHTTQTHSSAYSRITSSLSIKKITLPSFLRITHNEHDELLNKLPLGKSAVSHASDCPTDSSSIKTFNEDLTQTLSKTQTPQTPDEFITKIFEKRQVVFL